MLGSAGWLLNKYLCIHWMKEAVVHTTCSSCYYRMGGCQRTVEREMNSAQVIIPEGVDGSSITINHSSVIFSLSFYQLFHSHTHTSSTNKIATIVDQD